MATKKFDRRDYAQEFTDKVITLLESGNELIWRKGWEGQEEGNKSLITKKRYNGINSIMLMVERFLQGYTSSYWATFKQIQEAGGTVKKGSKGAPVVFYKPTKVKDKATGEDTDIVVRKFYTVFNLDCVEGIEEPAFDAKNIVFAEKSNDERIADIKGYLLEFAEKEGIDYKEGGNSAYYSPVADRVVMPTNFLSVEAWAGTITHEFIHSTGHKKRMNRFADEALATSVHREEYAKEELVAEMGAGMLCAMFGVHGELENHVSYLASWLTALKNDKNFIFSAASQAQKAINFIVDAVEGKAEENETEQAQAC